MGQYSRAVFLSFNSDGALCEKIERLATQAEVIETVSWIYSQSIK
jgi:hypothetical protein